MGNVLDAVTDAVRDPVLGALGLGGTEIAIPAEAPGLVIKEITGRKRSITLRGRMLPFRRPKWEGSQRAEVTYYPGNPEGTLQLFGPESGPTIFTGVWREKYLQQSGIEVKGFGFPASVEDLVKILDDFRKAGSVLDVQWSFLRRRGHLRRFAIMPDRVEDMEYELEFQWFSDGTQAPAVVGAPLDLNAVTENMNALSDLAAFDPFDTLVAFEATIFQAISNIQDEVDEFIAKVGILANATTVPARVEQGVRSSATTIAAALASLQQQTAEQPYTKTQTTDNLAAVITMQVWLAQMTFFAGTLRGAVLDAAANVESRAEPDPIRTVIMDQSGSLRVVAQREYGNADAWTTIADANGFESARVPPGTEILIPPAGRGATGVA